MADLRTEVLQALAAGPATTTELRARLTGDPYEVLRRLRGDCLVTSRVSGAPPRPGYQMPVRWQLVAMVARREVATVRRGVVTRASVVWWMHRPRRCGEAVVASVGDAVEVLEGRGVVAPPPELVAELTAWVPPALTPG